jgi:hypothetical protein
MAGGAIHFFRSGCSLFILSDCLKRLSMSQTLEHQADHRHVNEGFAGGRQALVVFAEPTLAVEPGEGAFNDPTMWLDFKLQD